MTKEEELYKLSCNFKETVFTLGTYQERMRFYGSYYEKWYSLVKKDGTDDAYPEFNGRISKLFVGCKDKIVFLTSPSDTEIDFFSKNFKKVYFANFPYRPGEFPANVSQIRYDGNLYLIIEDSIKESVDYAFSHHVIEHILKIDIGIHLRQVLSLLKSGGEYLIICPSSIRIKKDECSKDRSTLIAANHHIGRYGYNDIITIAKNAGFRTFFKPLVNPFVFSHFHRYEYSWTYKICEIIRNYISDFMLSAIAINSLYIKMVK
jgi:hypothetical protein